MVPLSIVENLEIPSRLLPVLNGLSGDVLAEKRNRWAIQMSFRLGGEDISIPQIKAQVPLKKQIVILVHGLMADETIFAEMHKHLEKNHTVLTVRYNTGKHISQNGRNLLRLLDQLYRALGEQNYTLVGHSMGGLVIRSACYYAQKRNLPWLAHVPNVFLIAVPNSGAGLEKLGHVTASTLKWINRWHLGTVGNVIQLRSNGIKDLRLGLMLEKDWRYSKTPYPMKKSPVPPVEGVHYHILLGSLHRNDKSFLARFIGDGMVSQSSGISKTLENASTVKIFPGTGHNSILKNRRVLGYMSRVLQESR